MINFDEKKLNDNFRKLAYSCKMSDIADKLKLPETLPETDRPVYLPSADMKTMKELNREFIAECGTGHVVVNNVLTKLVRLQQITSGFCFTQENVLGDKEMQELNTAKEDALADMLEDLSPKENVVVFCIFKP